MSELRRMMMAKKKGGLPPGVVLYDRLVGDGTARIMPNIIPQRTMKIGAECVVLNNAYSRDYVMANNSGDGSNKFMFTYNAYGGTCGFYVHGTPTNPFTLNIGKASIGDIVNAYVDYTKEEGKVYVRAERGTSFRETTSSYTKIANLPIFFTSAFIIGGYNLGNHKRFYVYDNGILIRDMYPCTYNGVAGMWDMVNNQFYGNANTSGSFSVAND